jgi:MFS family permease
MKTLHHTSSIVVPANSSPAARLWQNKFFNRFWVGQTFSVLGDAFAIIAFPLLVLQATGSVAQMGMVSALMSVGRIVAGLFSGMIVDRVDRRQLMIICDTLRALLFLFIPLCWLLVGPQIWVIYVTVILGGILGMVFQVSYVTAITNMVDGDQITEANSRLQTTFAVASVLGPVLAGLVATTFGATQAIIIDALTFVVSAVSLIFVRLRPIVQVSPLEMLQQETAEPVVERKKKQGRIFKNGFKDVFEDLFKDLRGDFSTGLRFVWQQPMLRAITFILGTVTMPTTGILDLLIFDLKHDLHEPDLMVGVVFGLAFVGSILGGVLTPLLRKRLGFGPSWLGCLALMGLSLILIGLIPGIVPLAILAICFMFSNTVSGVCCMSLRQQITPDYMLGRVTSVFWTMTTSLGPVGAAVVTALGGQIGVSRTILFIGIACVANAVSGFFTPARRRFPESAM